MESLDYPAESSKGIPDGYLCEVCFSIPSIEYEQSMKRVIIDCQACKKFHRKMTLEEFAELETKTLKKGQCNYCKKRNAYSFAFCLSCSSYMCKECYLVHQILNHKNHLIFSKKINFHYQCQEENCLSNHKSIPNEQQIKTILCYDPVCNKYICSACAYTNSHEKHREEIIALMKMFNKNKYNKIKALLSQIRIRLESDIVKSKLSRYKIAKYTHITNYFRILSKIYKTSRYLYKKHRLYDYNSLANLMDLNEKGVERLNEILMDRLIPIAKETKQYVNGLISSIQPNLKKTKLIYSYHRKNLLVYEDKPNEGRAVVKFYMSSGDMYAGEYDLLNHKKEGYGIAYYSDGRIAEGEWEDNLFGKFGKIYYETGNVFEGEIRGSSAFGKEYTVNGGRKKGIHNPSEKIQYYRIELYEDGDTYEGQYRGENRFGIGIYSKPGIFTYLGEFSKESFNGFGKIAYSNGDCYRGYFKDDQKEGIGEYFFAEANEKYLGYWEKDAPNGYGLYYYNNGDNCEGEIENGQSCGIAIYREANGNVYEGRLREDKYDGYGTMYTKEGEIIQCKWKNNNKDGMVYIEKADHSVAQELWKDGILMQKLEFNGTDPI